MGIVLKVTEAQLVNMADDIGTQIDNIEKQFAQIEKDISKSQSYWEGDASDAHKKKYDTMKESIATTLKNLKKHPENLLKMAEVYRRAESATTQTAQSLPTNVII